ncbi:MAG: 30S ribosomal protein S16 [Patescibacteria group bacterium]|nr:30S ribosomal protein S16 [Patescibacteria group bacterium]
MLVIRLSRRGKKKQPIFRFIISEKTKDTQADYLEALGFYNPHSKEIKLKEERIKYWIDKGATLSDSVNNLLIKEGVIKGKKRVKGTRKKKEIKSESDSAKATPDKDDKAKSSSPDNKEKTEQEDKEKEKSKEAKEEEKKKEKKPEEKEGNKEKNKEDKSGQEEKKDR